MDHSGLKTKVSFFSLSLLDNVLFTHARHFKVNSPAYRNTEQLSNVTFHHVLGDWFRLAWLSSATRSPSSSLRSLNLVCVCHCLSRTTQADLLAAFVVIVRKLLTVVHEPARLFSLFCQVRRLHLLVIVLYPCSGKCTHCRIGVVGKGLHVVTFGVHIWGTVVAVFCSHLGTSLALLA